MSLWTSSGNTFWIIVSLFFKIVICISATTFLHKSIVSKIFFSSFVVSFIPPPSECSDHKRHNSDFETRSSLFKFKYKLSVICFLFVFFFWFFFFFFFQFSSFRCYFLVGTPYYISRFFFFLLALLCLVTYSLLGIVLHPAKR